MKKKEGDDTPTDPIFVPSLVLALEKEVNIYIYIYIYSIGYSSLRYLYQLKKNKRKKGTIAN